jgi:hypothetical protein
MQRPMELTLFQNDWVLKTNHVAIRFGKDRVFFEENGGIEITATPYGFVTDPQTLLTQTYVKNENESAWWCQLHEQRLLLRVAFRRKPLGRRFYEIDAVVENEGNEEDVAFRLRLKLNNNGDIDYFFVSDTRLVDDFLRRLMLLLLWKQQTVQMSSV